MADADAPDSAAAVTQPAAPGLAPKPSASGIRPLQALRVDQNITENWKLFKQKWQLYTTLTDLSKQPDRYQVALLLHSLGDDALRVYNGFTFHTPDDQRTVEEIIEHFDTYATGEVNETYERFKFHRRNQQDGETFEMYLAALRNLLKT